ncbi:MAG: tetratricopeptide repeat protein [Thermodesulfobacteriota bacterium]
MNLDRRVVFLMALLVACVLAGCVEDFAGQGVSPEQAAPPPPQRFVKEEHLCADLIGRKPDVAEVKKDLADILSSDPDSVVVRYYRPPYARSTNMAELIAGAKNIHEIGFTPNGNFDFIYIANLAVSDARISAGDNIYLEYEDLLNHEVRFDPANGYPNHPYNVVVSDVITFSFMFEDFTRCVTDELLYVQQSMWKGRMAEDLAAFQPVVDRLRAMPSKPQVSEEQRKYIVQANSMTQKKQFDKAMALYGKALDVDPASFPAAYYNMALIASQQGNYHQAILNMRKYLLLAPQAEDARTAQDKIYEWQAAVGAE